MGSTCMCWQSGKLISIISLSFPKVLACICSIDISATYAHTLVGHIWHNCLSNCYATISIFYTQLCRPLDQVLTSGNSYLAITSIAAWHQCKSTPVDARTSSWCWLNVLSSLWHLWADQQQLRSALDSSVYLRTNCLDLFKCQSVFVEWALWVLWSIYGT